MLDAQPVNRTLQGQASMSMPVARPRRIAALIATSFISGPGRQLVSLATDLRGHGVDMTILLLLRPGSSDRFAEFARDHGIACQVMTDRKPIDLQLCKDVRQFIQDWKPHIVQTHGYKATGTISALRWMGLACPWVGFFEGQTDKGLKDRIYHRLDLRMLRSADRVVVMSKLQREMFPGRAGNVRVVHNAVPDMSRNLAASDVPAILQRRRGAGPVPLIGAIGRLSREKGVDVLLESLAVLKSRGIASTGVIVGDGPLEQQLTHQARALGISERVVFAGRVESMAEVYAGLDLMVIPSRSEGLPSVLLEAMQTDLPVVSTRVGAMIEIAADHPDALTIVPPERPDLLADGIAAALAGAGSSKAAAARTAVTAAFSVARRGERMLGVYEETLRAKGRS